LERRRATPPLKIALVVALVFAYRPQYFTSMTVGGALVELTLRIAALSFESASQRLVTDLLARRTRGSVVENCGRPETNAALELPPGSPIINERKKGGR
jgi:hypothetical protein